ncbi:MAG: peptidase domain-containing ABC transporter [Alphaproteobacteria bacterium]|nr:peptidase domain-containing ABC transporter [Alphaproteobacteria bacterium]
MSVAAQESSEADGRGEGLSGSSSCSHTALHCLVAVAQHHGIPTSVERLVHDHVIPPAELPTEALLRIARRLGLKAKAFRIEWKRLVRLGNVFPALARLANGNTVVLAGVRPEEGGHPQVAVLDPLADQPEVMVIKAEVFLEAWSGELILLKRPFDLADENQPFGLGWFVGECLRQKSLFRDIAIAALTLNAVGLVTPIFFQLVIDKVLVHHSQATLHVLTIGIVLALIFEALFGYLRQYLLLVATNRIDIRLSTRTFGHLLKLPIDFFETNSAGVVLRHMQQAEKIRQFLTGRLFLTLLDATALLIFLPVLLTYSLLLTGITLLFALLIALVVVAMIGPFRRRLADLYNAEAGRQAMLVETIGGMRTVKSLAVEPAQRRKWDTRAAQAVEMHFRVGRISIGAQALTGFLEKLMMVAVVAIGAQAVFDEAISVGVLIAFQMLSGRVVTPLVQIVGLVQDYQETALSLRMLGEVMNRRPERFEPGIRPVFSGRVQFDGVSFRYPGSASTALDHVSLDIPAGAVVGVVGRSGSGKSTLTRLIQRLYQAQEGVVRLDGTDVREIDLVHLRRSIGVVLQENFLFRGTIRENIAMTRPAAGFEDIAAVARQAGADEFIERLPQGFETVLEENAVNLSGGQKQRLAIARALLTQPRILILDEATSALDPDSEAIFMDNLAAISAGRTVLIVSHRLTTLVACDAIIVLERGRVTAVGTHDTLLNSSDLYRHLWKQQNRHL